MAKLLGNMMIKGRLGDLVFYVKRGKCEVMKLTSLTRERVKTSKEFVRTRENASEFGRAMAYGKKLRSSIGALLVGSVDLEKVRELAVLFLRNLQSDTINDRGARNLNYDTFVTQFQGFNFNHRANWDTITNVPLELYNDRATGVYEFEFGQHNSRTDIIAPAGTTHYQFICGVSCHRPNHRAWKGYWEYGNERKWNNVVVPPSSIIVQGKQNDDSKVQVFAVGVQFLQLVNGKMYLLADGKGNATMITNIDVI